MPRLSIIIPVLGSTNQFEEGLVSVLQHRPADSELVVVLRGEYDDPYNLRDEDVRFVHVASGADDLAMLNRGIAVAAGDIVHLLACGAQVGEQWADHALRHFDDPQIAAVAPLVIDAARPERILSAGVSFSRGGVARWSLNGKLVASAPATAQPILGPSTVAGFYRAATLFDVKNELDSSVGTSLADIDLALQLQAAGCHAVIEPASHVIIAADLVNRPHRGIATARQSEKLFWRHLPSTGKLGAIARHAMSVAGEALIGIPTGRIIGQLQARFGGVIDALGERFGRRSRPVPAEREPAATNQPSSLRIDSAHPRRRRQVAEPQRPLRRSA